MDIQEALRTAIEYEKRVRDTYQEALAQATDPVGKRVFELLAGEESDHVSYLLAKLETYKKEHALSADDLDTDVPSVEAIQLAGEKLQEVLEGAANEDEVKMLQRARTVELETSEFYKKMVDELPAPGKTFFKRFVEIEQGHVTLVEAELEYLQHKGAWMSVDDGELKLF